MFKPTLPLSNVQGWAITSGAPNAAHTVTCTIQPGPRFKNIVITGNGGVSKKMTDLIGDIRVIANDETVRLHSAAELNAQNVLYGPQYAAFNGNSGSATAALNLFQLPIFFSEPWRRDGFANDLLAWNTKKLRNLRIEVDIKADTFTTPEQLSFMAEADYADLPAGAPDPMGLIVRVDRTTLNLATGWNDYMLFPRSGAYQEINLVSTAITELEVLQGSAKRIGPITLAKLRARQIQANMEPLYRAATSPAVTTLGGTDHAATRGMTDIVFDHDDDVRSSLGVDGSQDFNVRLNISTGAAVVALYKRFMSL